MPLRVAVVWVMAPAAISQQRRGELHRAGVTVAVGCSGTPRSSAAGQCGSRSLGVDRRAAGCRLGAECRSAIVGGGLQRRVAGDAGRAARRARHVYAPVDQRARAIAGGGGRAEDGAAERRRSRRSSPRRCRYPRRLDSRPRRPRLRPAPMTPPIKLTCRPTNVPSVTAMTPPDPPAPPLPGEPSGPWDVSPSPPGLPSPPSLPVPALPPRVTLMRVVVPLEGDRSATLDKTRYRRFRRDIQCSFRSSQASVHRRHFRPRRLSRRAGCR